MFVFRGFHEQRFLAILRPVNTILQARMNGFHYPFFVLRWNLFDVFNRRGGLASNSHLLRGCSWKCGCRDGGRGTGHFHRSRAREKKFSIERFAEKPCWQSLLARAATNKIEWAKLWNMVKQTSVKEIISDSGKFVVFLAAESGDNALAFWLAIQY